MGRITKSEAKAIREEKVERFSACNPFQAPRKGVDNGAAGRVFELMNARDGSTKRGVSKGKQADNYVSIIQPDGSKKRYELESKTNGGRVDEVMEKLENGRDFSLHIVCRYAIRTLAIKCARQPLLSALQASSYQHLKSAARSR